MGGMDQEGLPTYNLCQIKYADPSSVVNRWEIKDQLKAPSLFSVL